jgi:hypothetical protein
LIFREVRISSLSLFQARKVGVKWCLAPGLQRRDEKESKATECESRQEKMYRVICKMIEYVTMQRE